MPKKAFASAAIIGFSSFVASCTPRAPSGAAHAALAVTWHPGSDGFNGRLMVDLRDCTMVIERAWRMPRSGRLDAAECASLADKASALPRVVEHRDCGPIPAPVLPSFEVAYRGGTSIGGPRCTTDDRRDRELLDAIRSVVESHGPALESSGATPPGECDPIECRPAGSPPPGEYEFSSDDERCMRDAAGTCAWRRR